MLLCQDSSGVRSNGHALRVFAESVRDAFLSKPIGSQWAVQYHIALSLYILYIISIHIVIITIMNNVTLCTIVQHADCIQCFYASDIQDAYNRGIGTAI